MSQNFCTSCGAPLVQGQKFCTGCGKAIVAPIPASDITVPLTPANDNREAPASLQPPSTVDMAHSAGPSFTPTPSGATAVDTPIVEPVATPTMPLGAPATTPVMTPDVPSCTPSPSSKKGVAVALLGALVGVAIIVSALFVAGVLRMPGSPPDEPAEIPQEEPSTPDEATDEEVNATDEADVPAETSIDAEIDAQAAAEDVQSETAADRAEVAIYDKLLVLYDDLGVFDERISEAAQQFNENYLSPDYEARCRYATEAETLLNDIYSSYDDLYGTTISPQSPNAAAYEALDTCYEDCVQRISVISEAWIISLSYSDPSAYRDEILAPIMRDNVDGSNFYYTEFQETYPLAEPVAP